MLTFSRLRANVAPTYSVADLTAVAVTAAVVALWAAVAAGAFSIVALLACEAAFLSFYLVGSLLSGWRRLATGLVFDLPLRLLVGYAVVNTALFALAWLSPLGIVANFLFLLVLAASVFAATRPARAPSRPDLVGLLAVGLSLAAAALWCQDSIRPPAAQGDMVIFKPWIDSFYHAVHIGLFGAGHGWGSIEDFRLSGVPARLYHYGIYLTPAFVKQAAGISAYAAFGGILTPMGVFFTGLGAYVLVASFWDKWPAFAACAALLLLPDGAEQGMRNPFFSYHWLTQISPGATYGLALLAVAWLFVLHACKEDNRVQLVAGWLAGAGVLVYKAHFFIASSLLLLLFPALFFGHDLGRRKRAMWAGSAVAFYVVALLTLARVPGMPLIRFDFSSVDKVLHLVVGFTRPGPLRDFLAAHVGKGHALPANLLIGTPFVLFAPLGALLPLLVILAPWLRKRMPPMLVAFPLLVLANFWAMFFGLALDFSSSTPDELSHRPFVIVFFVVATWLGGAAGLALIQARKLGRVARPTLVGLAVALLAVPSLLGPGVHHMWSMPMFSPVHVPIALLRTADYMREHGEPQDLFQDSQFDRVYALAALSERRPYVAHTLTLMPYRGELVDARSTEIDAFMQLRDTASISATARKLGLRWFVLEPSDSVAWPPDLVSRPAFQLNGYRLYRF